MSSLPKDPWLGKVLDGLYRLDQRLGVGGMGAVYLAWHLNLQRHIAVKLLHPQLAVEPKLLQRFQREASILSSLGHPSIVAAYDFGVTDDGTAYLAMELVRGESLRDRVARGPLTIEEVLALYEPLCEALDQAHRVQVLHRDLKPDNIMLPEEGGVKILDFGMAKLLSDKLALTSERVVMGTANYIAPERAMGHRNADASSDIFALGVILYEVLCGRFAFYAEEPLHVLFKVIQDPVPPLGLADEALSARLDHVIAIACAKEPQERYQSATALWEALEAAATGQAEVQPLPEEPSAGPLVKASVVHALFDYVRERYGEAGLDRLRRELGPQRVDELRALLPSARVDMSVLGQLHRVAGRLFDDGSLDMMRDAGRHFAERTLTGVYRAFLHPGSPDLLMRRSQRIFSAMASSGQTLVEKEGGGWRIVYTELPALTRELLAATAGWVQRYLELAGAMEVSIVERFDEDGPVGELHIAFAETADG